MPDLPLLQLSLDFTSPPAALAVALRIASAVDVIEVGTPLCKSAGLEAIRAVREVCPDKLIYADFKTPDVGALEAQMAFDFSRLPVSLLITGRSIHQAADPLAVALEMRSEIARLWAAA